MNGKHVRLWIRDTGGLAFSSGRRLLGKLFEGKTKKDKKRNTAFDVGMNGDKGGG